MRLDRFCPTDEGWTLYALPSFYSKTAVYWVKLVLASVVAAASAVELLFTAATLSRSSVFNVFVVSQLIQTAAYTIAIRLHYYEQTRARKSSGILLLFWLATIFVQLVNLRTDRSATYPPYEADSFVRIARYAMLLSIVALFCAELWPRKLVEYVLAEDGDNDASSTGRFGIRAPVEDANIFSQLTFAWLSPLFEMSQRKNILEDDLWEIPT
ncbi:hypothetical protein GGI21_002068, partial [Coemansia aciculifera]